MYDDNVWKHEYYRAQREEEYQRKLSESRRMRQLYDMICKRIKDENLADETLLNERGWGFDRQFYIKNGDVFIVFKSAFWNFREVLHNGRGFRVGERVDIRTLTSDAISALDKNGHDICNDDINMHVFVKVFFNKHP